MRERSERSWQSRHGPESSQDPGGYRARHARVAAADACPARSATAEPWQRSQYSSANRASPKPTVVLAGGAGLSLAANLAQARLLVDAAQLIVLGRDEHLYTWTTTADVPLGR